MEPQAADPCDAIEYYVGNLRRVGRGGVVRDMAESAASYRAALNQLRGAVEVVHEAAALLTEGDLHLALGRLNAYLDDAPIPSGGGSDA